MAGTDWAIPQQAKLKYTQLFNIHDRNRSGFLSGLQCRDILMQSGLSRNILAEIWNLADINADGQLTREEFILAMHLTNQVRAGNQLPVELPPDLVPPSYRKPRSISASSVQSAASASSTNTTGGQPVGGPQTLSYDDQAASKPTDLIGSILNTNTFEDKRRENFEKGRAELERRRLKMIESQISVLSEQLTSWKKQVAEAKAKIDAMRSDRDSKAGMMTSLEAQLQTVRDRKIFLQHEEQKLIAIAKDLNLVNSAHSTELDQQACAIKRESIKQMKNKLIELQKEKEEKSKELAELNKLFEESKVEFKSVSDQVTAVYQNYKEKLSEAKRFLEQNKSKPIDLDAAWDSAPTNIVVNNHLKGVHVDDPWLSSSLTQSSETATTTSKEPFAFNANTSSQNPDSGNSFNNNNDDLSKARDYSAFDELTQNETEIKKKNEFSSTNTTNELLPMKKKYRTLYAFEARNPDELTINPGDIITGSEAVCEPGWLSGECNGRSGLFPEAYVESLPDEVSQITSPTTQQSTSEGVFTDSSVPEQFNLPAKFFEGVVKYKAIYAFEARNPDELTINPGDIITGVEGEHEPGWLMGELFGRRGLFPEAYVEKFASENTQTSSEQSSEQTTMGTLRRGSSSGSLRSKKSRAKKAEVATVIANYRALGQEQLNLEKGQLVLIRRKMDSGWWEGELQIKGKKKQFGWFPSSYVKSL